MIDFSALAAGLLLVFGASYPTEAQTPPKEIRFQLYPNKQFLACMAASYTGLDRCAATPTSTRPRLLATLNLFSTAIPEIVLCARWLLVFAPL